MYATPGGNRPAQGGYFQILLPFFGVLYTLCNEMNLWMCFPAHLRIVPFDRLVLDNVNGRVISFTNLYIPGLTL